MDLRTFIRPPDYHTRSKWAIHAWWFVHTFLFVPSPPPMNGWRKFLLSLFDSNFGEGFMIGASAWFLWPWNVQGGDYVWIGEHCIFNSFRKISIGNHAVISQRTYLATGGHRVDRSDFKAYGEPISIGNGVWLSTDVFVGPGVTIGDNVVVGARSNVFDDLPPNTICMGSPAKPVKKRVVED
jgi:putative colanic acid biosynthesis acetyltransferase WcaF